MNRFLRLALAPLVVALALGFTSAAYAGEAQSYLQGKQTELTAALRMPKNDPARTPKLETLLDGMFDYDKLASDTIPSTAPEATAEQLSQFRTLLKKLVRNAYQKNIEKTLEYEVTWVNDSGGTDHAVVETKASPKRRGQGQEEVSIKYKMSKKNGVWMITDVVTEEASLVNGYKNQFGRALKNGGWDNLINKLKTRAAKGR